MSQEQSSYLRVFVANYSDAVIRRTWSSIDSSPLAAVRHLDSSSATDRRTTEPTQSSRYDFSVYNNGPNRPAHAATAYMASSTPPTARTPRISPSVAKLDYCDYLKSSSDASRQRRSKVEKGNRCPRASDLGGGSQTTGMEFLDKATEGPKATADPEK